MKKILAIFFLSAFVSILSAATPLGVWQVRFPLAGPEGTYTFTINKVKANGTICNSIDEYGDRVTGFIKNSTICLQSPDGDEGKVVLYFTYTGPKFTKALLIGSSNTSDFAGLWINASITYISACRPLQPKSKTEKAEFLFRLTEFAKQYQTGL